MELYNKLDNIEMQHIKLKQTGTFSERCSKLEKHLNIYVFPQLKNGKEIDSCSPDEDLHAAMMFRLYYIENNIDITEDIKKKFQEFKIKY